MFGFKFGFSFSSLSRTLAQILYSVQGIFEYQTDNDGNTFIDNKGSSNTTNDLLLYSGRGIELTGTQSVDVPIHHTLGEELVTNGTFDSDVSGWNLFLGSQLDYSWNSGKLRLSAPSGLTLTDRVQQTISGLTVGTVYVLSCDITKISGSATVTVLAHNPYTMTFPTFTDSGKLNVSFVAGATSHEIRVQMNSGAASGTVFDFDNISVKQITTENSFLTYQDLDTKEIVTLGNSVDGGSSKELVTNGDFSDGTTGWTANSGGIITNDNGSLKITGLSGDTAYGTLQIISTEIGKTYRVTYSASCLTNNNIRMSFGATAADLTAGSYTGIGNITTTFTAITTTTYLSLYVLTANMDIAYLDNVSVREILPISTTYTFSNKTVNNILTHTTNWSEADRAKIEANQVVSMSWIWSL
jgi:hypothetical protein